jgi:hypothetical protein
MSLGKVTVKELSNPDLVEGSHNLDENPPETPANEAPIQLGPTPDQQIERQALNEGHPPDGHASTTPSAAAKRKQRASESHKPRKPSSLRRSIELSDDEEEKAPSPPRLVGFAEHGQTLGSGNSSINPSDNADWLLIPVSKGIQTLSPSEAARLRDPKSFDKVYIVFKDKAPLEHADPWGQVLSDVQGVYQSEIDANNKVISLYESEKVNTKHSLELRMKGEGSQSYGYETSGSLEDAPIVRVHVQQWIVTADMNVPEKVPARRPKKCQKIKSMLDLD